MANSYSHNYSDGLKWYTTQVANAPVNRCKDCGAPIPRHSAFQDEIAAVHKGLRQPGTSDNSWSAPRDALAAEIKQLAFERDRLRSHVSADLLAEFDALDARQPGRQCPTCVFPKRAACCPRCGFARPDAVVQSGATWRGRIVGWMLGASIGWAIPLGIAWMRHR